MARASMTGQQLADMGLVECPICRHAHKPGACRAARTPAEAPDLPAATLAAPATPKPARKAPRRPRGPNATERAYRDAYLTPDARFEPLTFRLANGHRYTPDWVEVDALTGAIACHEVKGAYRLPSHGRARLAWDQARVEWPSIDWAWAERQEDGTWRVGR